MVRTQRLSHSLGFLLLCWLALWVVQPAALAERFKLEAGSDLIGTPKRHLLRPEDSLPGLAVDYALGYVELIAANPGLDPWLPAPQSWLQLPTQHLLPAVRRQGIVINLPEMRLYFFEPGGAMVESFPIGVGREGWDTPTGSTTIVAKRERPSWTPPASIRAEKPGLPAVVAPGPDNPLGGHALYLGWTSYLLHGTNKPHGVGRRVSHGCIRMYQNDVARLFRIAGIGTPVTIVDQPFKAGWRGNALYFEAHPSLLAGEQIEMGRPLPELSDEALLAALAVVLDAAGDRNGALDLALIHRVARERRGLPVQVNPRE